MDGALLRNTWLAHVRLLRFICSQPSRVTQPCSCSCCRHALQNGKCWLDSPANYKCGFLIFERRWQRLLCSRQDCGPYSTICFLSQALRFSNWGPRASSHWFTSHIYAQKVSSGTRVLVHEHSRERQYSIRHVCEVGGATCAVMEWVAAAHGAACGQNWDQEERLISVSSHSAEQVRYSFDGVTANIKDQQ